jgi:predicted PurR-regulated permease PerM
MAVVVSIALLLIDVKFAVIIGLLTGIGNLIPYVGPVVGYGFTAAVCLLSQDYRKLIIAIVVLFIIQTIDGNVINPKFLSHAIKVHPVLVIVSLLIGSAVGGFGGMILAVPLAALLKTWFDRGIASLSEKRLGPEED